MEKITTFIYAINFTYLPNVSQFCLRITYTQGKFHPNKSLYIKYFPEGKTQTNLKTGQSWKSNIPRPSQVCINSGFLKWRINNFHRVKIFNLSEKNTCLQFLHGDTDKFTKQTCDKHGCLNPCYFVTK